MRCALVLLTALLWMTANVAHAEPVTAPPLSGCASPPFSPAPPAYKSAEVLPDGRAVFRLCAPQSREVLLLSSDMAGIVPIGYPPDQPDGLPMNRDESGLWSVTTPSPLLPGVYRYLFRLDGVRVPDPLATRFAQERRGVSSVIEIAGNPPGMDEWRHDVPHGLVSTVTYWSSATGGPRRAHVYTPPGYMRGTARYPVLYLVHGAGDSDDSWTSEGHANVILDNLIAAGKARPMIVVMPFGHTPDRPGKSIFDNREFADDLLKVLVPWVDDNFRTEAGARSRAMAGLSMGGQHTFYVGLTHPEVFRSIGVFSIGLGVGGNEEAKRFGDSHAEALARAAKSLKLMYLAVGRDDFVYETVGPARSMLDRFHITHVYRETGGGHTWLNWREYLADFVPRLFR